MPDMSAPWILPSALIWVLACAVQDYRSWRVSNWLTLPVLAGAVALRVAGITSAPWGIIVATIIASIAFWGRGGMGGADAKAWIAFSFLGTFYLAGAIVGRFIWFLAVRLAYDSAGLSGRRRAPAFPGFAMGLTVFYLLFVF